MTKAEIKILGEIFSRISQETYEELGAEFKLEKEKKLELDKKFSSDLSIEQRAKLDNKYIDETAKEEILDVISCLKDPKYSFIKDDIDKLTTFISKLNFILSGTSPSGKGMADRMNNIKNGLIKEGKSLELDVLFNEFKKATSWKLFKADTSIDSAFFSKDDEWKYVYLFSNCKNCQDKINYPLYYAAWQVIADWCFKVKTGDYEAFCEYYRKLDFLGTEKQLNFSCYYELLRLKLRNDPDFTKWLGTLEEKKRKKILEEIRETEVKDNEGMPIDENNIEEQIMDKKEKFKEWLKINMPKSADKYFSYFNTANEISNNSNLGDLYNWTIEDWGNSESKLRNIPNFKEKNSSGHNSLTASIGQYKKFLLSIDAKPILIPPIKPFNSFGWRWASTGISSQLNLPNCLFAVMDAILVNGNGNMNQTSQFKLLIKQICINKYALTEPNLLESLTKENHPKGPIKNIIENSGNYWRHIGLIDPAGKNASVTDLGRNFLIGQITKDEFVNSIISGYKIPNNVTYDRNEIADFNNNNIEIFPFQIILGIYEALECRNISQEEKYLSENDLKRIVIPFSIFYVPSYIGELADHVLKNRITPQDYLNWPNCYNQYTEDKGERMINEYLFFLEAFEFLRSNTGISTVRSENKKYFATEKLKLLFDLREEPDSSSEEKNDDDCVSIKNSDYKENKIFFGAPGTGKSTRITQILEERKVCDKFITRVTFHPEYDYSSFVGGYKPFTDGTDIKYAFVPQTFTNIFIDACNNPESQFYLIIEEINRGNCAEIFGDLFQLLDRNPKYPISTSKELREYLSGVDSNNENRIKVATEFWGRENGKMRLPNNITLWATMNTSDQSLMPMDSAFKRRWEWEYIPINYSEKNNRSATFEIEIGKKRFSWIKFIEAVNKKISNIETLGMDKCLGNYFVDVPEGKNVISEPIFKNKVLFYLWNDVFKDETDETIFKNANDQNKRTYADFFDEIKGSGYIIDLIEKELELTAINIIPSETDVKSKEGILADNIESSKKSDDSQ